MSKSKNKSDKSSNISLWICSIVGVLVIGPLVKSCVKNIAESKARSSQKIHETKQLFTEKHADLIHNNEEIEANNRSRVKDLYSEISKGGLIFVVPKRLAVMTETNKSIDHPDILNLNKFEARDFNARESIIIKRFEFKDDATISPNQAADLCDKDFKNEPKYKSTRRQFASDTFTGILMEAEFYETFTGGDSKIEMLFFRQGKILWEIRIGTLSYKNPVIFDEMCNKIYSSISIQKLSPKPIDNKSQ